MSNKHCPRGQVLHPLHEEVCRSAGAVKPRETSCRRWAGTAWPGAPPPAPRSGGDGDVQTASTQTASPSTASRASHPRRAARTAWPGAPPPAPRRRGGGVANHTHRRGGGDRRGGDTAPRGQVLHHPLHEEVVVVPAGVLLAQHVEQLPPRHQPLPAHRLQDLPPGARQGRSRPLRIYRLVLCLQARHSESPARPPDLPPERASGPA